MSGICPEHEVSVLTIENAIMITLLGMWSRLCMHVCMKKVSNVDGWCLTRIPTQGDPRSWSFPFKIASLWAVSGQVKLELQVAFDWNLIQILWFFYWLIFLFQLKHFKLTMPNFAGWTDPAALCLQKWAWQDCRSVTSKRSSGDDENEESPQSTPHGRARRSLGMCKTRSRQRGSHQWCHSC